RILSSCARPRMSPLPHMAGTHLAVGVSMATQKTPPVISPAANVGEELARLMGDTGRVEEVLGGYRIPVYHSGAFPWAEVFKVLLYRDFKVSLTHHKADIFIEA